MGLSTFISTVIGEKAEWRRYKARVKQLPSPYREVAHALERYLMHFGGISDGVSLLKDLIDLFEQSAMNHTPIRQIVGEDPVEFIETFASNYPAEHWLHRERERLTNAVNNAADK